MESLQVSVHKLLAQVNIKIKKIDFSHELLAEMVDSLIFGKFLY